MNLRAWLTSAGMVAAVFVGAAAFMFFTAPDEDIDGLVRTDHPSGEHTEGEVDYDETPPMGGEHDPRVLTCGTYDRPVREELAVHDLEHGVIWVTYDPGLSGADIAELEDAAPDDVVISPYDGLPSPVVISAWNRQVHLDGVDDPRLQEFVDVFEDGHSAPALERGIGCQSGVVEYEED